MLVSTDQNKETKFFCIYFQSTTLTNWQTLAGIRLLHDVNMHLFYDEKYFWLRYTCKMYWKLQYISIGVKSQLICGAKEPSVSETI